MPLIKKLDVSAYTIPTDQPESDGTLSWDSTTVVLVEVAAGAARGLGYSYTDRGAAGLIDRKLSTIVLGQDAFQIPKIWADMIRAVRNVTRPGIASMAIAAVDSALWDLKARLLGIPLTSLLGRNRDAVPVYGSGGFTSYSVDELKAQLRGWIDDGFSMVKMKVGREPEVDLERVAAAREAIGSGPSLFVDANGAYTQKQAIATAMAFEDFDVRWLEEPVSSDDLAGLRFVRSRAPATMAIAAGEYGFDPYYFERMLESHAVDVLQIDGTRCGGITGFMKAAEVADAFQIPVSAHTAPGFHLAVCCWAPRLLHLEYFHDHARIENMLFDGVIEPVSGTLRPDTSRPGNGLEIKRSDASRFAA